MFLLKPLRYLAKALAAQDSPKQLAAGFALGLAAGLIPKTSLLAHLALVGLCLTTANLGAGYAAAFLAPLATPLTDRIADPLGRFLLVELEALGPLWTFLYNLPVVPWTAFNNTIVLGSTALGLLIAYPAYRLSEPLFARYQARFGERFRRFKIVQLLLGAELGERFRGPS
jgi:uncharacterized protein (TIGR03546 family)